MEEALALEEALEEALDLLRDRINGEGISKQAPNDCHIFGIIIIIITKSVVPLAP